MSTVAVSPARFTLVAYDADEIADIARDLATRLHLTNPIVIEVDETTPLAKMSATVDHPSSDSTITLRLQSGALEDTKNLTNFSATRARISLGRLLLRASDRMRDDFADAPADRDLTNAQNTAWKVYCGGRLERLGLAPIQQQYRYDFRNRFGFRDDVDTVFDRLWTSENLGWHDLPSASSA